MIFLRLDTFVERMVTGRVGRELPSPADHETSLIAVESRIEQQFFVSSLTQIAAGRYKMGRLHQGTF